MTRSFRSPFLRHNSYRLRRYLVGPLGSLLSRQPKTVVRVPPLDEDFANAIKLVAPQYASFAADEKWRETWEHDQNNSCWAEDRALAPFLAAMPSPKNILEIGAGFGRSAVFFSKRRFPDAKFHLFDATGHGTKYEMLGNRYEDSFCGNLPLLEKNLRFNGITNYSIIDAEKTGGSISGGAKKYDFIYSFYAVGFHWSVDHWIDEILAVAHDATLVALIVPSYFAASQRVASLPHVLVHACSPMRPWLQIHFLVFTPKKQAWFPG